MDFKNIALIEVGSNVFYGFVAISLAIHGTGVWSLVCGIIVQRFLRMTLFLLVSKYRPKIHFDLNGIRDILFFGFRVTGTRFVNFFAQRADYLLLARLFGFTGLGYYSIANEITAVPQNRFAGIVYRVTYPIYSKIQDDDPRLGRAYLKVVGHVASITFPILLILMATSKEFITVFYGVKWLPVVPLLRILCIVGCFRSVGVLVGSLILAKGRADIEFKWSFVMLLGTFSGTLGGARWGFLGAVYGYALSFFVLLPIIQQIALKLVRLNIRNYLFSLFPAGFSSMMAATAAWCASVTLPKYSLYNNHFIFISSFAIGLLVYVISYSFFGKEYVSEIKTMGKYYLDNGIIRFGR